MVMCMVVERYSVGRNVPSCGQIAVHGRSTTSGNGQTSGTLN